MFFFFFVLNCLKVETDIDFAYVRLAFIANLLPKTTGLGHKLLKVGVRFLDFIVSLHLTVFLL